MQTLFGKIALDSVKIADCRNIVILPDLQLLFQKKSIDQGVVLSGKAALRFCQGKTQMEVSSEIGISQAQVSRLEKGAINSIRRNM